VPVCDSVRLAQRPMGSISGLVCTLAPPAVQIRASGLRHKSAIAPSPATDAQRSQSILARRPQANIDPEYLLMRAWRQSLLICAYASRGTESHAVVAMDVKSQFPAAVVAAQ